MNHTQYPHVLIETGVLAQKLDEVRLIQVDLDPSAYDHGHLPGAVCWKWAEQLRSRETQEIIATEDLLKLLAVSGISPDTTVVLYGDNNNWFACWAYWLLYIHGVSNVFVLDGGIKKWMAEGLPVTADPVTVAPADPMHIKLDDRYRASMEQVFQAMFVPQDMQIVDVRSAAEFRGELTGPGLGCESTCAAAGHIPTAVNIPWNLNCNADGTFKSSEELRELYASFGINAKKTVITCCAVGERSSLSWFVLKQLLGHEVVMNYDRSMSHWTRIANAPIVMGDAA